MAKIETFMNTLKEITSDLHREAERVDFVKNLLTGKETTAEYINY